jgi:hypothetical protein
MSMKAKLGQPQAQSKTFAPSQPANAPSTPANQQPSRNTR